MTRALLLAAVLAPAAVSANPRPLPMSQPYETLVEGKLELEQRVDAVPVRVFGLGGDPAWNLRAELVTELRLGWSDRLEIGVSVGLRQDAHRPDLETRPSLRLAGFGQRARLRLAEAGDWPVDVALQVAIAEHHDGAGAAERLILAWRRGALRLLANLEVEQRYGLSNREWQHTYAPSAGVAYEFAPGVSVGAEVWARGRLDRPPPEVLLVLDDPDDPQRRTVSYVGPAMFAHRGRLWLTGGVYVRTDLITSSAEVDDRFGRIWVRALLGLEL